MGKKNNPRGFFGNPKAEGARKKWKKKKKKLGGKKGFPLPLGCFFGIPLPIWGPRREN